MFLTRAAGSIGVAISCKSFFALAPVALHFRHSYEIRRLITCARIVGAFHDRVIQFSFASNACRVRSCIIYNHWKCPRDLDREIAIFEIRRFGMEKSGIIVETVAFCIFCIDAIVTVVGMIGSIAKVEIGGRRECGNTTCVITTVGIIPING